MRVKISKLGTRVMWSDHPDRMNLVHMEYNELKKAIEKNLPPGTKVEGIRMSEFGIVIHTDCPLDISNSLDFLKKFCDH